MHKKISGLYAVTPDAAPADELLAKVGAALRGGARVVQYRDKSSDAALRSRQARELASMCRSAGAVFIVNDDVELARAVDADGVHLGKEDAELHGARAVLGSGKMIGVSCYNELARARHATKAGADYVAFGSFFDSATKPAAVRAGVGLLRDAAAELSLPIVAIGGIEPGNAAQLLEAGADAVAVVSALFDAPDVEAQARRFASLFNPFIAGKQK